MSKQNPVLLITFMDSKRNHLLSLQNNNRFAQKDAFRIESFATHEGERMAEGAKIWFG